MSVLTFLVAAALLEVGGDALVRWGMRGGQLMGFVLGASTLTLYGITVNMTRWDFGRLLGVYIAMFFVIAQAIAVAAFHENVTVPILVGGALIISGGLVVALWQAN